jgi:hypothetical protein
MGKVDIFLFHIRNNLNALAEVFPVAAAIYIKFSAEYPFMNFVKNFEAAGFIDCNEYIPISH